MLEQDKQIQIKIARLWHIGVPHGCTSVNIHGNFLGHFEESGPENEESSFKNTARLHFRGAVLVR